MMIYRYNDDDYDDDSDDDDDDDAGEAGKVLLKKLKSCFTSISNSINSLLFQVQLHLLPYSSQFNSKNTSEVRPKNSPKNIRRCARGGKSEKYC